MSSYRLGYLKFLMCYWPISTYNVLYFANHQFVAHLIFYRFVENSTKPSYQRLGQCTYTTVHSPECSWIWIAHVNAVQAIEVCCFVLLHCLFTMLCCFTVLFVHIAGTDTYKSLHASKNITGLHWLDYCVLWLRPQHKLVLKNCDRFTPFN